MRRPMPIAPVPPETARVARAAFPKGHRYLRLADELEMFFTDDTFQALFPRPGQPAWPPWRLAFVTLLPCAEGLSDRQAAHAVRRRIDWTDVLRLERTDAGFEAAVLSECRTRLITGTAEYVLFDPLLTWCRDRHLSKAGGRQRTDSTPMLAAVRALNRIEVVSDTLRHALHSLASVAPAWLRTVSPSEWKDRDARRAEDDRLPTKRTARAALALALGHDGWRLLAAVDHAAAPPWRREMPAVVALRRVWLQHSWWAGTQLPWREAGNIPPAAQVISSPDDAEAHDARQYTTPWVGYTVHLTESCEADLPHLITHVETTRGPAADGAATPTIHQALEQRGLLPRTPIVDTGFLDAARLVESQAHYGVDLLGPTRLDDHWQARAGAGLEAPQFQIAGDQQHATCPAGQTRSSWTPAVDNRGNPVMKIPCSTTDCRRCDEITQGIRSQKRDPRRTLSIRPQPPDQALQTARQRDATGAFQTASARRAGREGPMSRETRSVRLRRTRAIGRRRVPLGHILAAGGLNVVRLGEWLLEMARAKTRMTPFARLMADAA